jgi:dimethylargininase
MPVALTRAVPRSLASCELTHLERSPIDVDRAAAQHAQYEAELRRLGCRVEHIDAAHELPDSVFVEDAAVVFDEVAVITRPGARSRQAETAAVGEALSKYRPVERLTAPASLDGGDVLRLGRMIYVGISTRTNVEGARQLGNIASRFGYTLRCARIRGCLHLKSAVTALDDRTVICNPEWIDARTFDGYEACVVDAAEPFAANVLSMGGTVICAAAHERTAAALRARGYDVHAVDVSELAKAEAGVTCCSLIVA